MMGIFFDMTGCELTMMAILSESKKWGMDEERDEEGMNSRQSSNEWKVKSKNLILIRFGLVSDL